MQQLGNAGPAAGHAPEPQEACAPTCTVQEEEERPIAPGSRANEIMVLEDEAARLEAEAQADGVSEAKRYALRKQAAAAQVARAPPATCMLPARSQLTSEFVFLRGARTRRRRGVACLAGPAGLSVPQLEHQGSSRGRSTRCGIWCRRSSFGWGGRQLAR